MICPLQNGNTCQESGCPLWAHNRCSLPDCVTALWDASESLSSIASDLETIKERIAPDPALLPDSIRYAEAARKRREMGN